MVTITIKENSKAAKDFISFVRSLPFVEIKQDKQPNKLTDKTIRTKKTHKAKSVNDLIERLNA